MKCIKWQWALSVLVLSLLMGCASKEGAALEMTNNEDKCIDVLSNRNADMSLCELVGEHNIIFLSQTEDSIKYIHTMYNNSNAAALQMAAEYTLKKGDKYFAIAYPSGLSNFSGSFIDTPQEYFSRCNIGIGKFLLFNTDPCEIHSNVDLGQLGIVTYFEKPSKVLSYNANDVIKYLKKENVYIKDLKFTRFGVLGGK